MNALANFCFLTKDTNLEISDRLPEEYFPEVEERIRVALASQWIPTDPELWKIENYRDFLEARQELLPPRSTSAWRSCCTAIRAGSKARSSRSKRRSRDVVGGITSEAEEEALVALNDWVEAQGLPRGQMSFDYADPDTREQQAVFDLAWPNGIQEELSQPVAVLLNEGAETLALASSAGFRCFTTSKASRRM